MPGGSCSPEVRPAIFSAVRASTLCTAAVAAAAIRSSSMSRSSPLTLGSICTRFTSCLPFMVIFTMPPPDSPVTSMLAISAWAFCMLACMAWACFIRLLKFGFILRTSSGARAPPAVKSFYRAHGVGEHGGAEALAQSLDAGVLLEGAPRHRQLLVRGAQARLRGGLRACRHRLEFKAHRLPVVTRERLGELLLQRRRAQQLVARVERQAHDRPLPAEEDAVAGGLGGG